MKVYETYYFRRKSGKIAVKQNILIRE